MLIYTTDVTCYNIALCNKSFLNEVMILFGIGMTTKLCGIPFNFSSLEKVVNIMFISLHLLRVLGIHPLYLWCQEISSKAQHKILIRLFFSFLCINIPPDLDAITKIIICSSLLMMTSYAWGIMSHLHIYDLCKSTSFNALIIIKPITISFSFRLNPHHFLLRYQAQLV